MSPRAIRPASPDLPDWANDFTVEQLVELSERFTQREREEYERSQGDR